MNQETQLQDHPRRHPILQWKRLSFFRAHIHYLHLVIAPPSIRVDSRYDTTIAVQRSVHGTTVNTSTDSALWATFRLLQHCFPAFLLLFSMKITATALPVYPVLSALFSILFFFGSSIRGENMNKPTVCISNMISAYRSHQESQSSSTIYSSRSVKGTFTNHPISIDCSAAPPLSASRHYLCSLLLIARAVIFAGFAPCVTILVRFSADLSRRSVDSKNMHSKSSSVFLRSSLPRRVFDSE